MTKRKTIAILLALMMAVALASTSFAMSGDRAARNAAASAEPTQDDDIRMSTTTTSTTPNSASTVAVAVAVAGGDETLPPPSEQPLEASEESAPRSGPAHQVVPRDDSPPPARPTGPIGYLDDDQPVPAAFDFTAEDRQQDGAGGVNASDSLAPAPSCSHQCITRGVAYAHGSGIEIVVETSVPAKLFISVVADLDHDGDYEDDWVESTAFGYTSYSWVIEDLVPGETYYVMAAATDSNFYTSYAWGEFTLP